MISFSIFLALIIIVAFLLILVVMVQNPKSGGLSSTFGGGSQLGGVQKTTDFLEKSTWVLGASLMILIVLSSISFTAGGGNSKLLDENAKPASVPAATKTPADKPAEKPAK
jgi:preprotein translocase subunit SecG